MRATAEAAKQRWLQRLQDPIYLTRLTGEHGGDVAAATQERDRRIREVEGTKLGFLSPAEMKSRFGKGDPTGTQVRAVALKNGEVCLPTKEDPWPVTHELSHRATRNDEGIPKATQALLTATSNPRGLSFDSWLSGHARYLLSPNERLARFAVTTDFMAQNGIKAYGESFKQEHYDKLMDAYRKNVVPDNVREFIETTRNDFETFRKLFDGIASTDGDRTTRIT